MATAEKCASCQSKIAEFTVSKEDSTSQMARLCVECLVAFVREAIPRGRVVVSAARHPD